MIQCGSVNTSCAARYTCGYRYKILLSQTQIKTEVFLTKYGKKEKLPMDVRMRRFYFLNIL